MNEIILSLCVTIAYIGLYTALMGLWIISIRCIIKIPLWGEFNRQK